MRPLFHPSLVNGRCGDPAVYVETLFERHSLLLDLGDIASLAPRKVQRIEKIFISHTHIDHFIGFDQLLRLLVGREKTVALYGPAGLAARVHHKLQGYQWDLAASYRCELVFIVSELLSPENVLVTTFRLKSGFRPEPAVSRATRKGVLCEQPMFRVSAAFLAHHAPCLGFALEEAAHVNVWKNRLAERNLLVGPWLRALKRAVIEGCGDDHLVRIDETARAGDRLVRLGDLRDLLSITAGQKIAYVTDVADSAANRDAIVALARNADILFIESAFAADDVELARARAHLTTTAAGEIARAAGARRIEPFHFSPRYAGSEERMLAEVMAAFGRAH